MLQILTLKPEDLQKPEIIDFAAQGKVVLLMDSISTGAAHLVENIMKHLRLCKGQMNERCNMRLVRQYVSCIVEANYEDCLEQLSSSNKCSKFICQVAGSLCQHNVFVGSAGELARCMRIEGYSYECRRRYINYGRKREDFLELFSALDDAIPNYPSHLCSVKQKNSEGQSRA